MKYPVFSSLLLALFCAAPVHAQTGEAPANITLPAPGADTPPPACSDDQMRAASAAVDHVTSWDSLHAAYSHYKQCDDGAISEGSSEAISRLLADHWPDMTQALPVFAADPAFEGWVVSRLDTTDNEQDLEKIDRLAKGSSCPATAKAFCKKITEQIESLSYE